MSFLLVQFLRSTLFSLILLSGLLPLTVQAQRPSLLFTGTVQDEQGGQVIPYATIALKSAATNNVLAGATTDESGSFRLRSDSSNVYLSISFIGFETKEIRDFSSSNGVVELGTISLPQSGVNLDAFVVEAERSSTEFKLDKRVFNVGKDLSSTGASATEVLNNVPSVNVNIEGEITLRGNSGVQVLINGKPSVLASEQGNALGTITADMIEKVEVITNPSAKYEAEGTSGIINIVLKKEEKKGVNGSVTINTGFPHNHSLGLSVNRRTEHLNVFSQFGAGYRELPRFTESTNIDRLTGETIYSDGEEYRNEQFYNFILGADYYINPRNILTLSGRIAYEVEDQPSETDFRLEDSTGTTIAEWKRTEVTEALNPKYQYELQYKSDFKDHKDHVLLLSALGNFFGKDQSSEFTNEGFSDAFTDSQQRTRTNFQEAKYTFNADYTKPIREKFTLETGAQYVRQDVSNDFAVSDIINDVWTDDPNLTNVFDYNQNVFGAYVTGAYEGDTFGLKLGLRVENTDLTTLLVNTGERNATNFTNLFPSAHASYKLTERFSLQAGYSRRIYRPRLWDLNPFFNIRNNFNVRTGNPDLLPEFSDSYELQTIYNRKKASMNAGFFYLYTTEVIERISTFVDGVSTNIPVNLGVKHSWGIEYNAKWTIKRWMILNGDVNANRFQRLAELEGEDIDFTANQWTTKWTLRFKLPANIDTEVTGRYQSGVKIVQGNTAAQLYADLGVRKKLMDGKAVINFSIRDVFASRIREMETDQDNFYVHSRNLRGRFITLGFSYGFGKGEAMEFSSRKR